MTAPRIRGIVLRIILLTANWLVICLASHAMAEPMRVLWWDVSLHEPRNKPDNRQHMARYLDAYKDGTRFDVDYRFEPQRGAFARHMASDPGYRIIVVTAANNNLVFNSADTEAFRAFYASGPRTLMLDGTLGIRNSDVRTLTKWPGVGNSSANMLVNQMEALRQAGGGLLIGTDHGKFQRSANAIVSALVPQARFSRITNPSRNGQFFGELLLAQSEAVKPLDMLRHWEAIPNQGQAPSGMFQDFMGQPVTLYTLVEAADKPGGGPRRPYITATIDPGSKRFDIAEDVLPVMDRMPTRKSLPSN